MGNETKRHPNFKGGRLIASNGYVLIFVGVKHHLADVRGYAYEHRIVAEEKYGRRLERKEIVHHIDHNKANNAPENLEIVPTMRHHLFEHRTTGNNKKHPDESNAIIDCACGCGQTFPKYDNSNRPRKYVSGHNRRKH